MGRQHGLQVGELRPLILRAIEARLTSASPAYTAEAGLRHAKLRELLEALWELDPPILEMIRGQAEGLKLDFDTLFKYSAIPYLEDTLLPERAGGCTTWAASGEATRDGKPILAKNRDYWPQHLPLQVVVLAEPEAGYRYAYLTSAGSPGVFCAGINEVGLAVADTHVSSLDVGPGIPSYSLMMHLLEDHKTVRSALDYLRSARRMGRNNLILADAKGDMAVFEAGYERYGVVEPQGHVLVNTNHFVSPKMRAHFVDDNPPHLKGNSLRRYERVRRELGAAYGGIDAAFARRLMAEHGSPLDSICTHLEPGRKTCTISTAIFLPAERAFLLCIGNPCEGEYRLLAPWDKS